MDKLQIFLEKNKVFLLGLLGSIGLVLQEFIGVKEIQWKAVGFAVFAAVLSYIANNLRGQWVSISTILLMLGSTFATINNIGDISWPQLLLQASVAIIAAVAPPPKSIGYEKSQVIQAAKEEGAVIQKAIQESEPPQL